MKKLNLYKLGTVVLLYFTFVSCDIKEDFEVEKSNAIDVSNQWIVKSYLTGITNIDSTRTIIDTIKPLNISPYYFALTTNSSNNTEDELLYIDNNRYNVTFKIKIKERLADGTINFQDTINIDVFNHKVLEKNDLSKQLDTTYTAKLLKGFVYKDKSKSFYFKKTVDSLGLEIEVKKHLNNVFNKSVKDTLISIDTVKFYGSSRTGWLEDEDTSYNGGEIIKF